MTTTQGSSRGELSARPEGCREVIKKYVRLWSAKNSAVSKESWENLGDALNSSDDGYGSPSVRMRCKEILEPYKQHDIPIKARDLAQTIERSLAERWIRLILENEESPQKLRDLAEKFEGNIFSSGWDFLYRLMDARCKPHAIGTLVRHGIIEGEGDSSLERIPPFDIDSTLTISWRKYGNLMGHIIDTFEGREFREVDPRQQMELFFDKKLGALDQLGELSSDNPEYAERNRLKRAVINVVNFLDPGSVLT